MKPKLLRSYFAEALGVASIVTAVLGAGFMAQNLDTAPGLLLLMVALAVGAVLLISIAILGPISGAQFNPALTLALAIRKKFPWELVLPYFLAQFAGAILGAVTANLMFGKTAVGISETFRATPSQLLGEVVASAGLVLIVLLLLKQRNHALIAPSVALWVVAGHFFTSSTSFANPAVTLGRALSEAPTGISWSSVPLYVAAQLLGAVVALVVFRTLFPRKRDKK